MSRGRHWTYHGEKRRAKVLKRDNHECQIRGPGCLGQANTVDHIVPKSLGGPETEDNLRAACRVCNQRKGTRADVVRPMVVSAGSRGGAWCRATTVGGRCVSGTG